MWKKLKFKIARFFYPYVFYWWKAWSTMYRLIYHRKYNKIVLPRNLTHLEANNIMKDLKWRPDRWRQLWDVVGSPRWTQHCINPGDNSRALDCDEFACWATNTVHPKFDPRIFCFSWYDEAKDKYSGHAMCWVRTKDGKYHHIGNWGLFGPYNNLNEACQKILGSRVSRVPIGWALLDRNLDLIISGRDLPPKKIL